MLITTKGRYALRFMIDLAENEKEGPVTLKDVSMRQGISVKYLEHVVTQLNRAVENKLMDEIEYVREGIANVTIITKRWE